MGFQGLSCSLVLWAPCSTSWVHLISGSCPVHMWAMPVALQGVSPGVPLLGDETHINWPLQKGGRCLEEAQEWGQGRKALIWPQASDSFQKKVLNRGSQKWSKKQVIQDGKGGVHWLGILMGQGGEASGGQRAGHHT